LRSIYLLSWSGEEYGLLGSTGWAELNPDRIERAVAYLNADIAVSGDVLTAKATPSLATAWQNVLVDLNATENHSMHFSNGPLGEIRDANTNWVLNQPDLLGSGSDYAVFLDHFGIASLDFSFDKPSRYGQYHSVYDSFAWMDAYGGIENEPGSAFRVMAFAAKIWGLLALRLADSDILPFDQIAQGKALALYTDAIEQQQTGLDLSKLYDAVEHYKFNAASLQFACAHFKLEDASCNAKLGLVEREFLSAEGLPGRPWFKHILQAPGMYLGYAAEAFPGIQQAIDEGDLELAKQQVDVVTQRIHAAATFLTPYVTQTKVDQ
jgi:N-acetylated-alpha-linked acidic dipeptidase